MPLPSLITFYPKTLAVIQTLSLNNSKNYHPTIMFKLIPTLTSLIWAHQFKQLFPILELCAVMSARQAVGAINEHARFAFGSRVDQSLVGVRKIILSISLRHCTA